MISTRNIAIVGQGYVGLPLALAAVESGWKVFGIDNNRDRLIGLRNSKSHIEDVSDEMLNVAVKSGLYEVTDDVSVIKGCEIVIFCLPTPLKSDGLTPDTSAIETVCGVVAPWISSGTLVINESTSYPGTLRKLIKPLIERSLINRDVYFATAPERVDPANAVWNHKNTPRIVAGLCEIALERAFEFYSSICSNVHKVDSPEIAEYAKLLENTFRQVNIALVSALARTCAVENVSIYDVIEAASTKPYGFMKFLPTVGVGGHCIPVDPMYLLWHSVQLGKPLEVIENSQLTNTSQPSFVLSKIQEFFPDKQGKVLVYGISYKSGVSDTRESPNVLLLNKLRQYYSSVKWSDPKVKSFLGEKSTELDVDCDLLVAAHPLDKVTFDYLQNKGIKIFDCTGQYFKNQNVGSI